MIITPWSNENDTYKLSDEISLQKADKAEWNLGFMPGPLEVQKFTLSSR